MISPWRLLLVSVGVFLLMGAFVVEFQKGKSYAVQPYGQASYYKSQSVVLPRGSMIQVDLKGLNHD